MKSNVPAKKDVFCVIYMSESNCPPGPLRPPSIICILPPVQPPVYTSPRF